MMHRRNIPLFLMLVGLMVCRAHPEVWAEDKGPKISIQIDVKKETRLLRHGQWVVERVPVDQTEKDDVLVYTITYRNVGNAAAQETSVVDRVPEGTVYVPGSATGEDTEIFYSIDGGLGYQRPPVTYVVKRTDGSLEKKTALPEMFTHIKWLIKKALKPGESGQLSFKAIVK